MQQCSLYSRLWGSTGDTELTEEHGVVLLILLGVHITIVSLLPSSSTTDRQSDSVSEGEIINSECYDMINMSSMAIGMSLTHCGDQLLLLLLGYSLPWA